MLHDVKSKHMIEFIVSKIQIVSIHDAGKQMSSAVMPTIRKISLKHMAAFILKMNIIQSVPATDIQNLAGGNIIIK